MNRHVLASLSLAGWSLIVAAVGVTIALGGFLTNALAIRGERTDRRQASEDAWAREWASQRPVVYPRVPSRDAEMLTFKNGGRGPALNVEGELLIRGKDGQSTPWSDLAVGTIAVDDEETAVLAPATAPPWPRVSGELRYTDLVGGSYVTRFDFSALTRDDLRVVVHPQEIQTAPQAPEPPEGTDA